MGNYSLAESDARKAVSLDPSNPTAHSHLGNALSQQGQGEEARQSFQRGAKLGSRALQELFEGQGQDWQSRICLRQGFFSIDSSDGSQWVVKRVDLRSEANESLTVSSVSAFFWPERLWNGVNCGPGAPLEGAIWVQDESALPKTLSFHEQWDVERADPEVLERVVTADQPLRLEHHLANPLTLAEGQNLFVAYRRAAGSSSETCFVGCLEPYAVNREWIATSEVTPLTWEPVSTTIQTNLAICVNPGCTWP